MALTSKPIILHHRPRPYRAAALAPTRPRPWQFYPYYPRLNTIFVATGGLVIGGSHEMSKVFNFNPAAADGGLEVGGDATVTHKLLLGELDYPEEDVRSDGVNTPTETVELPTEYA